VLCTDLDDPTVCNVGSDGVGINGPFAPACGAQIALSFLADTTGPLNLECLQELFPLDFEGSIQLTRASALTQFGTEDLWDNNNDDETAAPTPVPTTECDATCTTNSELLYVSLLGAASSLILGSWLYVRQNYVPISSLPQERYLELENDA
jgi:hypothetical protein